MTTLRTLICLNLGLSSSAFPGSACPLEPSAFSLADAAQHDELVDLGHLKLPFASYLKLYCSELTNLPSGV